MAIKHQSGERFWDLIRPYLVATAALVVATLLRMALTPLVHDRQPYLTYLAAVILMAWFVGLGPSLFTLVASIPLAAWFFIAPARSLWIPETTQQIATAGFVMLGAIIIGLGSRLWRVREKVVRTEKLLDSQVRELDTDRRRLQQDLGRLTEELRAVDRRREGFLALVADELRRPLIPIASAASFHSIAATASEMESAMEIVKQETTQLGRLIDDLVDAFRGTKETIELRRKQLNLAELAHRAAESVRSIAAQSGRELNVSIAKDPILILGDPERLERVIYNLLMNAIRSTNPGGQIWLSALARDGEAIVKIKDTGIGLTPDAIPRVFQLNSQLDNSLARERGGLGIRLTAVKPIVELHGGGISVASDGPGQGCEFLVRLPLVSGQASNGKPANQAADRLPQAEEA